MGMESLDSEQDYDYLLSFLPAGWQEQARKLGALRRCRKFPDAETLLRVLLIHLSDGCSLRETALRAQKGGIVDVSDVAIMDRLRMSGEWLRWLNTQLMASWVSRQPSEVFGDKWKVKLVDGTRIKEPGPTGSSWTIHYSIELPSLHCPELIVSEHKGKGESFRRFSANPGDLLVGDRAYGRRSGILHVVRQGADVLVRFGLTHLPLQLPDGGGFDLLPHLRQLRGTQIGDWPVVVHADGEAANGRVCAIRKSRQVAELAQKRVKRSAQKSRHKPSPESLEAAKYIFVFTTITPKTLPRSSVLEMYRGRWQIELVFKRLKSVLGLGHLRKTDKEAANAWIQGKLLVAFLVEALLRYGEAFFPWGYPIRPPTQSEPKPLA